MACKSFFQSQGIDINNITDVMTEIENPINDAGINCINQNQTSCSTYCSDLAKSSTQYYSCLAQRDTCPGSTVIQTPINCAANPTDPSCAATNGCCPFAEQAVQCAACVGRTGGQEISNYQQCLQEGGLSIGAIVGIVVGSVVGVILVIVAIVVSQKLRKAAKKRQDVVDDLRAQNVNSKVIQQISNLDNSEIDSKIWSDVDTRLMLKKLSKKVGDQVGSNSQSTQPRSDAVQLSDPGTGLFGL